MRAGREHVQLPEHAPAERVLRQHPLHCKLDRPFRVLVQELLECDRLDAADVAGVVVVDLVAELATCDTDLLRVHDDDVITHVDVRAVISLVLALQAMGNLRSETTERLVAGVAHDPTAAEGTGLGESGLHSPLVGCAGAEWGVDPRGPAKKGGEVSSSRCLIAKARPRGRPWCDPAADAAGNRRNCLYNAGPI